jgi:hypothetical protein
MKTREEQGDDFVKSSWQQLKKHLVIGTYSNQLFSAFQGVFWLKSYAPTASKTGHVYAVLTAMLQNRE